jgi:hypothetical protein
MIVNYHVLRGCMHAGSHSSEHPGCPWIGPWTQIGPNAGMTVSRQTKHMNVCLRYIKVISNCCGRSAAPQTRPSRWNLQVCSLHISKPSFLTSNGTGKANMQIRKAGRSFASCLPRSTILQPNADLLQHHAEWHAQLAPPMLRC